MVFDLTAFSISDMVVASGELRQATAAATSMEDASRAIVDYLRSAFPDPATGRPAFVLARMFHTVTWDRLTPRLRAYVQSHDPAAARPSDDPATAALPYLTLLATEGDHPHWSDRRASRDHQAIPLSAPDVVRRAPLALALLDRLLGPQAAPIPVPVPVSTGGGGGGAAHTGNGSQPDTPPTGPRLLERFDVFHVAEAFGSPYVPTPDFVRDFQIRSAIALGAVLDSGGPEHPDQPGVRNTSLYTALLYSRVHIPPETAIHFRTLAAAIRLALMPFLESPLFAPLDDGLNLAGPGAGTAAHSGPGTVAAPGRPARDGSGNGSDRRSGTVNLAIPAPAGPPPPARQPLVDVSANESAEQELRTSQRRLNQETRIVETLYSIGQALACELDLRTLAELATKAATTAIDAEFGACFYTQHATDGQFQTRFVLAGPTSVERFERLPMPRPTQLVGATFPGTEVIRCADVTTDPRYGHRAPFHGLPPGHPPVRSYLALPITTIGGAVLGSLYFGHHRPGQFTARDEQIVKGIAAQAAAAMDNARLYRQERDTAVELQQSLLPGSPPEIAELEIAFTYQAGAQGTQVGGDWFDVIPLAAGRVALVIGDVMGRGIRAAAIMGQLRTAVRAYAVMDLPPGQIMHLLNRLVCAMPGNSGTADDGIGEQIATCVYAVYDPAEASLTWASAGHMPPALITPEGKATLLEVELGMPLGIEEAIFDEDVRDLPDGTRLLLYTDGLVECHNAPLSERLTRLATELTHDPRPGSPRRPRNESVQKTCDRLLTAMLSGDEHDDVALLLIRTRATTIRKAALDLDPDPLAARAARRFVTATLGEWGLDDLADSVISVVTELVTNATQHAGTTSQLRLRSHPGRLIIEVADADGRIPRPAVTRNMDERHRGLLIVATLSQRWGVRPTDQGKVVWAEIAAA